MKVLHINSYFSRSNFYKNLYDKQIEYGLSIDVFVPVHFSFVSSESNLGDYTTTSPNHRKYERALFHLKHNKIYKDILLKYKVEDYSIIHAHSLFSNGYIAMKLKQQYGIPYVVAVRNTDVNIFFKYMIHLRKIGIQILNGANKIIFLSDSYKTLTIEKYIPIKLKKEILGKSVVIPNGIDDFWFYNKGISKERKHYEIRLLYVGAINKNKNVLTIIKAIEILINKGLNVSFTLVGKVEDKSVYRKIENLPYISYIKPKQKEELVDIYRLNDIFVMPSIHETFGLVYAEAMSQGLPVIYSKGQGFDGQFKEGLIGFHTNSTNEEELADRICDVVSNYRLLSKNSVNHVDIFNWDKIVNKYNELYTEINRIHKPDVIC